MPWKWEEEQQAAFQRLKTILSKDKILIHYDQHLDIEILCDASNVGIGIMLFHRYPDGSERPITNALKILSPTQRRYSQIQREVLAVIFGVQKFHHLLYGRKFIFVTDHKPTVAMFNPTKGTPTIAANRLARWALTLNQLLIHTLWNTVPQRTTKCGCSNNAGRVIQAVNKKVSAKSKSCLAKIPDAVQMDESGRRVLLSEFLNGKKVRTRLFVLVPSPAHEAKAKQAWLASKSQQNEKSISVNTTYQYQVGETYYTLYFSPKQNKSPKMDPGSSS